MRGAVCCWFIFGFSPAHAAVEWIEPNPAAGTSQAVVVDRAPLAHTAQLLPLTTSGEVTWPSDAAKQSDHVLDRLDAALKGAHSSLESVVKLNVGVANPEAVAAVKAAIARRFNDTTKPAVSFVVGALTHPAALVAMDAVAVSKPDVEIIEVKRLGVVSDVGDTKTAAVAILPPGAAVYVSGQAERGELSEATRKTLESLAATLALLKLNRSHVIQLKAFLRPMSDVALVTKEIARFFEGELVPPTVFVEWIGSVPIEIELIAAAESHGGTTEPVRYLTPPGVKPSPVYSRVAWVNSPKLIFVSGLYASQATHAEGQIRSVFASLGEILRKTGSDFKHLAKATYYVTTDEASTKLTELRPEYYDPNRPPAASKAMVQGVGLSGHFVTLDMIAVPVPASR